MKKLFYLMIVGVFFSCQPQTENKKMQTDNPFYQEWDTPYGVPPFEQIKEKHYMQAFGDGMAEQIKEVEAITNNEEAPTFDNTITAFEKSGNLLTKVSSVFFNLTSAHTNDSLQGISREISPILSSHGDNIFLNENFYARVKTLYDQRSELNLTVEQNTLLKDYHTSFVRAGVALDDEGKKKMRELNEQLSSLSVAFGENVLAETNKFELVLTNESLAGLPESVINAGANAAKERGYEGKYVFTTHRPSLYPFITYSTNRELREQLKKGYINRGDNDNKNDNKELARQLANVRLQKANLLGYSTWAGYILTERMLDSPDKVFNLLDKVWPVAIQAAKKERDMMKEMTVKEGNDFDIMPWDWWYYAEKIKQDKYNLDENEIRPYLKVDNVINGTFILANKLFGITFEEQTNIPTYHADVRTYIVKNEAGELIGIYLSDWFYRSTKRGGAWMNTYRDQSNMDGTRIIPIVTNVGNFTKPSSDDTPSLLSQDEATTLFHEFGHALHGLLSECTYPSISGTSTPRDFVEFPSQVMENWVFEPEMLALYAFHYETGEVMPTDLVDKIKNARQFNQGFETVEYMAASYLDMAYHTIIEPITIDADAFEKTLMDKIGMIKAIVSRYRTGYFQHAFSSSVGYSAGYYSYLNSEVMDADAFSLFKENGLFDKETANSYRENILSKGGTQDAMEMYVNFRGREPKFESILKRRGF